MFRMRISVEERKAIERNARKLRLDMSAYIRRVALVPLGERERRLAAEVVRLRQRLAEMGQSAIAEAENVDES